MSRPWHEQRTSERTIAIDGLGFDAGDDLIVHLVLERPDDPLTPQWEGSREPYVILFDLHGFDDADHPVGLMTADQRDVLFAEELVERRPPGPTIRITVPVPIFVGDSLSPEQLLAEFAIGQERFHGREESVGFRHPCLHLVSGHDTQAMAARSSNPH